MPVVIVFNPAAGRRRRQRLLAAIAALRDRGISPRLLETAAPGEATRLARSAAAAGSRMIVAAGGDGTIAEVVEGMAGSGAGLGILPLGTANVLAAELGLPRHPDRAAAVITAGRQRLLHPGLARFGDGHTRLFVQMLGAGFDAAVVAAVDPALKRRLGRGAYVWQAARQLGRYGFPPCRVALDGVAHAAGSVVVSKGRLYGGRHLLAPAARPDAPGFQVALLRQGGAGAALLAGLALPLDLLPRLPGVTLHRASRVRLEGEGLCVQTDGDLAGFVPVEVADAPAPILVTVP